MKRSRGDLMVLLKSLDPAVSEVHVLDLAVTYGHILFLLT